MRSIFTLLILCFSTISCKTAKDKKAGAQNYSAMEIYCFCFLSQKANEKKKDTSMSCSTPFRITPVHLLNSEYLLYKSNDSITIDLIANIIFNNKEVKKQSPQPESRFLILFKKDYLTADTVVFIDNKNFYHNNGELFEYSFNILDSIKKVIKMERINCK